jgi:hypothetical protein
MSTLMSFSLESIAFSVFMTYTLLDGKQSVVSMNRRRLIYNMGKILNKLAKFRFAIFLLHLGI